jgi:hypothetical protein
MERRFLRLSPSEKVLFIQVIKLKISEGSVFVVDEGAPTTDEDFIVEAFSKGSTVIEIAENS